MKIDDTGSETPRSRRNEETRQKIISAAHDLVTELGVEGLTIRALAERVNYSPTALYHFFKDKDELISILREDAWNASRSFAAARPIDAKNSLAALVEGGKRMYAFARENPGSYRFMMSPAKGFPSSMEDFRAHSDFAGLDALIAEGAAAGNIRLPEGMDARLMAFFCFIVIHGASMLRMGLFKEHPEEWDSLSESVIETIGKMFSHE
jgi:AcrR family transcriptional regulator